MFRFLTKFFNKSPQHVPVIGCRYTVIPSVLEEEEKYFKQYNPWYTSAHELRVVVLDVLDGFVKFKVVDGQHEQVWAIVDFNGYYELIKESE